MDRHPYFDLWLHDDGELESAIGCHVEERRTLHEWPLSCVQLVTLADGRRLVYKCQSGPNPDLEPEFYAKASSPILPGCETLHVSAEWSSLLLDYIDAPLLKSKELREDEAVQTTREILARIGEIGGDAPNRGALGGETEWLSRVDSTLRDLSELVDQGKFSIVTHETIQTLDRAARSTAIIEALSISNGLVHGDLNGGNVFLHADGYKVIDWHPFFGPTDLDFVTLARELGVDPSKYVHRGILGIGHFLRVIACTDCKKKWFPQGASYDFYIAEDAQKMQMLSA